MPWNCLSVWVIVGMIQGRIAASRCLLINSTADSLMECSCVVIGFCWTHTDATQHRTHRWTHTEQNTQLNTQRCHASWSSQVHPRLHNPHFSIKDLAFCVDTSLWGKPTIPRPNSWYFQTGLELDLDVHDEWSGHTFPLGLNQLKIHS